MNIELAIRAYHRGVNNALDERGDAYLARVRVTRARYSRNGDWSPSWMHLMTTAGRPQSVLAGGR